MSHYREQYLNYWYTTLYEYSGHRQGKSWYFVTEFEEYPDSNTYDTELEAIQAAKKLIDERVKHVNEIIASFPARYLEDLIRDHFIDEAMKEIKRVLAKSALDQYKFAKRYCRNYREKGEDNEEHLQRFRY